MLFDLPNFEIVKVHKTDLDICIETETRYEPSTCNRCNYMFATLHKHGTREQHFFDLPIHGKRVALKVFRKRFKCTDCNATFEEPLEDMHPEHRMTKRLVKWVIDEVPHKTFAELSRDTGVVEGTLRKVYNNHISTLRNRMKIDTPRVLGIDEIHLRQVHAVFTNIEDGTLLDIFPSNKQALVEEFLGTMDRTKVKFVCMDMHHPYRRAVNAIFPNALIVADRWHVQKYANKALDEYRKQLRADLSNYERKLLKREKHILLGRNYNLTEYEQDKLLEWIAKFPGLGDVYAAKEKYMDVWDAETRLEAETKYRAWKDSLSPDVATSFHELIRVMKNWPNEIFRYFEYRLTNATTEAINRQIRELYENGRGYSFEVFRAKLLFSVGLQKRRTEKPRYNKSSFDGFAMEKMTCYSHDVPVFTNLGIDIPTLLAISAEDFYR